MKEPTAPARGITLFNRTVTLLIVLGLALMGVLVYEITSDRADVEMTDGAPPGGTFGKFSPLAEPLPAPAVAFTNRDGKPASLADFRGHVVLVNLWATWCAPCVQEMPSLLRLQQKRGDLDIVAISEDRNKDAVAPFIQKLGLDPLPVYLDPENAATHAFKVEGLPTSFLIDRDGKIVGSLEGGAAWDSDAMAKVLAPYLAPAKG